MHEKYIKIVSKQATDIFPDLRRDNEWSIISNEKEAKESVQLEFVGGTVRMTGQQQTQCTSLR